jgi:Domain of unknown function (DUF1906)
MEAKKLTRQTTTISTTRRRFMARSLMTAAASIATLLSVITAPIAAASTATPNVNTSRTPIVAASAATGNDRVIVTQDQIWISQDRGARWAEVTPKISPNAGALRFAAADFTGTGAMSVIAVEEAATLTYRMLRSYDGGKNWFAAGQLPAIDSAKQHALSFASDTHGWLLVQAASTANFSRATLFRTADGGQSWSALAAPPVAGRILFTSAERGYLAGGATQSQLFTTQDGGASWRAVALPGLVSQSGVTSLSAPALTANGDVTVKAVQQFDGGKVVQRYVLRGDAGGNNDSEWQLVSARNEAIVPSRDKLRARAESANEDALFSGRGSAIEVVNNEVFEISNGVARPLSLPPSLRESAAEAQAKAVVQTTTRGFDVCEAPTVAQMQNWKTNSPYGWTIIYLGGSQRACPQNQLSSAWVSQVFAQGWRVVPTWVGPQSPTTTCTGCTDRISTNATTARQQGRDQAVLAANAAANIGLPVPSIIYYDLERYTNHTAAEEQFISGWVEELRARGHQSGVYSNQDFMPNYEALALKPDAVWIARWFTARPATLPSADSIPGTASTVFTGKRLWQYLGDVSVTYGGLTFGIDENVSNGPTTAPGTPPATPTGLTPGSTASPGPTLSTLSPLFSWTAVSGATNYSVAVRDLSTNTLIVNGTVSTNSFTPALTAGRPYRWAVSACSGAGCSASSAALYVTAPSVVNGACGSANGGLFDVKPTANLCSAGTASAVSGTGGWTWSCSGQFSGTTASCSAEFTGNVAPDIPTALSPGGTVSPGTLLNSKTVKLAWNAMPRAATYGVAVRDMSTNVLVVDTSVTTNSYTTTFLANRIYRWNVNACTVNNVCSVYSGRLYFKTPN